MCCLEMCNSSALTFVWTIFVGKILSLKCSHLLTSCLKLLYKIHFTFKWKWSDVAKYGDPYSEFVLCIQPIKVHTHSSEHTHTVNTHPEQWAAIYVAVPGEQLGVRCLAQGHLSRGIEGGESAGYSLPPPTIPAGPRLEPVTFGLRVRLSNH